MNLRIMRHVQVGGLVVGSVMGLTGTDTSMLPSPPAPKKVPHVTEVDGHRLEDDYFWLRDKPESGGAGLSGSGERVYGRGDEADRGVSEEAV